MTQVQEEIVEQPEIQQNNAEVKQEEPAEIEIINEEQKATVDAPQEKAFDPKKDKVDFTTPEQQEKFNHVYKQMKMSDARNQMQLEMLQKQQQRLDELETRFKNTDSAEAEQMLLYKIKNARDSGNDMAEIAAINELVDFKADKKLTEKTNRPPAYAAQPNPQEVSYIESVMKETDSSGELVRPYLYEGHPDYQNSINTLDMLAQKYAGDPQLVPKSLAELDKLMRSKMTTTQPPSGPSPRTPNPMQGGNLTNTGKKTTIKMTRAESDMLNRLNKSLPPNERISPARYAARLEQTRGKK